MYASALKHGDVLIYEHPEDAPPVERAIRLVEGSRFIHCGVVVWTVDSGLLVLEQPDGRVWAPVCNYQAHPGEIIHAVRPKFLTPATDYKLLTPMSYGYLMIADAMINHGLGWVKQGWQYKPFLSPLTPNNVNCAGLVGLQLQLPKNTAWCKSIWTLEPDDYFNHTETFHYLDTVEWGK